MLYTIFLSYNADAAVPTNHWNFFIYFYVFFVTMINSMVVGTDMSALWDKNIVSNINQLFNQSSHNIILMQKW